MNQLGKIKLIKDLRSVWKNEAFHCHGTSKKDVKLLTWRLEKNLI